MKEAIANVGVFNLMVIFVVIMLTFFIGSISYTKAYNVKDRIINDIELAGEWNDSVKNNIEDYLADVGYKTTMNIECPSIEKVSKSSDYEKVSAINTESSYKYCVYKFIVNENGNSTISSRGSTYYKVITYMQFDIPIIGQLVKVPVSGETKMLGEKLFS